MDKIKEQMTVTLDKVRDINIKLRTIEGNIVESSTEMINGILKALIIDSDKKITISITVDDITIYENLEFFGKEYIVPMVEATSSKVKDSKLMFVAENFYLNDKVKIRIEGERQTNVSIKLRVV